MNGGVNVGHGETGIELGVSEEERRATLKALFDPARDAADTVAEKKLKIE